MAQGIIISKKRQKVVILTEDGSFKTARLKKASNHLRVGETVSSIHIASTLLMNRTIPLVIASCLSAIILIVFIHNHQLNNTTVAYVSVDVNPSFEAAVNRHMNVLSIEPLNSEAKNLIKEDHIVAKNTSLKQFADKVTESLINHGYIKDQTNIVISTAFTNELSSDYKTKLQKDIASTIEDLQKDAAFVVFNDHFQVFNTTLDERKEARGYGLTAGKYLLYKTLFKDGNQNVTIDQVKNMSIKQLRVMASSDSVQNDDNVQTDYNTIEEASKDKDINTISDQPEVLATEKEDEGDTISSPDLEVETVNKE